MLDQRRAAFDPIAVIVISDIADLANFGRMDVAADDSMSAALMRRTRDDFLKARNELHRVLDLLLEVRGNRPIRQTALAAHPIQDTVELEQQSVGIVAEQREPLGVENDAVEFVAVQHQQTLSIGGLVHRLENQLDTAEVKAD